MEEKDFRYKVEHVGDYFVDMLGTVASAAQSSARGVILTYDIRQLERKQENLMKDIGQQVAQISKENPSLAKDEKMKGLLARLDETEKKLNSFVEERQHMLYPAPKACCSAETAAADTSQSLS
jgi:DNA repair exonuclease SbcCD ATPase subunit